MQQQTALAVGAFVNTDRSLKEHSLWLTPFDESDEPFTFSSERVSRNEWFLGLLVFSLADTTDGHHPSVRIHIHVCRNQSVVVVGVVVSSQSVVVLWWLVQKLSVLQKGITHSPLPTTFPATITIQQKDKKIKHPHKHTHTD
jgi:hypothetical protein